MQSLKLVTVLLLGYAETSFAQLNDTPKIAVDKGSIHGVREANGIRAFLGIPFASKPVGNNRFKMATAQLELRGTTLAQEFPPACPQDQGNVNWYKSVARGVGVDPDIIPALDNISEDCLYLNIWAPEEITENLPVMVWIHGGGNVNGWSHEPNYRGHNLSKNGVVVVSVQYRLGDLGFLPTPFGKATETTTANWGISDLVASLQWINKNIHYFGGDAGNITLFGESAGGGNIVGLMLTATAEGLFHKAIIQSGAVGPKATIELEMAQEVANAAYKNAAIISLADARSKPWREIINLHQNSSSAYYHYVVSDDNYTVAEPNYISDVPLIIGSNKNENLMYTSATPALDLKQSLKIYKFKDEIQNYLDQYSDNVRIQSDYFYTSEGFLCPSLEITASLKSPSYVYEFTRVRDGANALGAYHGAEIPYIFDTHDDWLPTDIKDHQLTDTMMDYWVGFAKNGHPNGDSLPQWTVYSPEGLFRLEFGERVERSNHSPEAFCALLKEKIDG